MDQGAGWLKTVAPGAHLGEATPDGQRDVTALGHASGERRCRIAEPGPEEERVALGEDPLALDRRRHRSLQPLRQLHERLRGTGRPEAHVEKGSARSLERLQGAQDGVPFKRRTVLVSSLRGLLLDRVLRQVVVRRHLHHHRPRDARPRDPAATAHRPIDFVAAAGTKRFLHDRRGDRHLVDVVQLVGAVALEPDAASEHEHGDVVEIGFGDPRKGVGEAGSGHHVDARHPARGSPVPIRHEGGRLLVRHQHRADFFRNRQRVVELDVVRAGDAEGVSDALVLECAHDSLRPGQPHRIASSRIASATRSASAMIVR